MQNLNKKFAVSVIKFLFLFLGLYYIYFEIQKINFDLIFNLNIYHLLIAFLFFLFGTSLFAYVWFRLLAESENISMLETIKIYFLRTIVAYPSLVILRVVAGSILLLSASPMDPATPLRFVQHDGWVLRLWILQLRLRLRAA